MKKLLKLTLIVLLIIALAFAVTGCGNKEENNEAANITAENKDEDNGKSKTYNLLNKVFSDGDYVLSLQGKTDLGEGEEEATITMAVKGENIYMDVDATSGHLTVMYKDNNTYMVSHNDKMYVTMEGKDESTFDDDMTLISKEDLNKMEAQEYKTGKETIDGTEYEYEEYEDQDTVVIERYYFSGNDLKYIKSIDEDGEEELMKVIKLSSEVDDSIFEVPSDYQKVEM